MSALAPEKMQKFLALARVLRATHERDFAPSTVPEDALAEVADTATMLDLNFQDEDKAEAKIENAALLLGHTLAMAELLMDDKTEAELEAMVAANEPQPGEAEEA